MLPLYPLPPKRKAASTINLDFSPDQVGAWLTKLPLADAADAAEKLIRFLTAFNRIELPSSHRRALLGLLSTSARHTAERLAAQQAGAPLPLPPARHRQLQLGQTLLGELANTHKLHILDSLQQGQKTEAAASLSMLMDIADGIMLAAFRSHTALPAGLWLDLHQSHVCASELQAADSDRARPGIADRYKAAMLLAVADPYQFTDQELDWARSLALGAGAACRLLAANPTGPALAPFHIQTTHDAPPQPLSRHQAEATGDLLFDTTPVARHLAQLGNAIKTGRTRDGLDLPPESDWPAYATLINKLKLRWGASKQRLIQRRRPLKETPYEITLGLDGLRILVETAAPSDARRTALCLPINDSAGGLALRHSGTFGMAIEVGEIVGIKQAGEKHWHIGLIRWFKQTATEELLFGVQLIGNRLEAIEPRRADGDSLGPGLLLHGASGKQADAVVLPVGAGRIGESVKIPGTAGEQAAQLGQRTEGNHAWEIFRVQYSAE